MIGPARPRRVLHIVHDYHPAVGGSELLFQRLAEGLAARGWDMWTFTSTARRSGDFIKAASQTLPAGRDTVNGLPVHRFGFVEFPPAVRRVMDATSHLWSTRQWPGYGKVKAWWVGPHMRGTGARSRAAAARSDRRDRRAVSAALGRRTRRFPGSGAVGHHAVPAPGRSMAERQPVARAAAAGGPTL